MLKEMIPWFLLMSCMVLQSASTNTLQNDAVDVLLKECSGTDGCEGTSTKDIVDNLDSDETKEIGESEGKDKKAKEKQEESSSNSDPESDSESSSSGKDEFEISLSELEKALRILSKDRRYLKVVKKKLEAHLKGNKKKKKKGAWKASVKDDDESDDESDNESDDDSPSPSPLPRKQKSGGSAKCLKDRRAEKGAKKVFKSEVNSISECGRLCSKDKDCKAFDVITSGEEGVEDACRGFDSVGTPRESKGKRKFCIMGSEIGPAPAPGILSLKDDKKDGKKDDESSEEDKDYISGKIEQYERKLKKAEKAGEDERAKKYSEKLERLRTKAAEQSMDSEDDKKDDESSEKDDGCKSGQIEKPKYIVFETDDNSYEKCYRKCKKVDDCVAFDYTTNDENSDACRGVSQVGRPRYGDQGPHKRKFCKMKDINHSAADEAGALSMEAAADEAKCEDDRQMDKAAKKLFKSDVNTVEECEKLCQKDKQCVAFDIITSDEKGKSDACRGLDKVGEPRKSNGLRKLCIMGKGDKDDDKKKDKKKRKGDKDDKDEGRHERRRRQDKEDDEGRRRRTKGKKDDGEDEDKKKKKDKKE